MNSTVHMLGVCDLNQAGHSVAVEEGAANDNTPCRLAGYSLDISK